jgi:hypothetical protein
MQIDKSIDKIHKIQDNIDLVQRQNEGIIEILEMLSQKAKINREIITTIQINLSELKEKLGVI